MARITPNFTKRSSVETKKSAQEPKVENKSEKKTVTEETNKGKGK